MKKVINKVLSIFLFCGIVFTSCEIGLGKAVDMEAPEITIIYPESYASTPKDILIKGYASDNESIKLLTISIEELGLKYQWDGSWKKYKGSGLIPLNESEVISNGDKKKLEWNITLNIENAVSGTQYTLYSQVEDEYGNTSSKSKDERSFTCDIEEPVVSVTIPELLKNYITPEESKNQYKLQDSKDVLKLINKSFVIEGTQKEDTKLGELYILLDTSSSPNVKSYEQEKDLNKITEEGKLICIKKIEGNRSWNTTVSESDIEQLSKRTVIRLVTESHDAAGNIDRRVQGWFIYDNEADTPWIEAKFGGENYENATSNAVYPNCALQGQCYDDDGLKEITITTYIKISEKNWQEVKVSRIDETILAKENYPTYYAWSINAISDKKTFKVEIECVDINGEKSEKVTRFLSVADVNPPKVEITPITDGLGDENGNITISGTVSDDAPLSKNLKMVRIKNNASPLDYYDSTYEGWTNDEVFKIELNKITENNGECKYSFSKKFNLFTDFGVSSTEIYNSMMLIFNMEDEKSASIVSLNLQGDTQPPVLTITKIQIKSGNSTQDYEISGNEWPTLPPASSNYEIQLVGTWSDNSANYWNLDNGKIRIGELIVKKDSTEKIGTPTIDKDGTWQSGYFSPGNSASSVYVSLKDFGGNTTEKKVSYYLSSNYPELMRVSSKNPDGSYKAGDKITITMEYNKKVTFNGDGAILTLNNGGEAKYDTASNSNGSSQHYYVYTVQEKQDNETLTVNEIKTNRSLWKDSDGNEMINPGTIPTGLNLGDIRNLKIDTKAPVIQSVKVSTPAGDYKEGKEIYLELSFSEDVTFANRSDAKIKLKIGDATTVELTPFSQPSVSTLFYKYTVKAGENGKLDFYSFSCSSTITDKAGNQMSDFSLKSPSIPDIEIDTTKPDIPSVELTGGKIIYDETGMTINITGFEDSAKKYYSVDDGTTWLDYTTAPTITVNGTYNIKAYQEDKAGNKSEVSGSKTVTIDKGNILTSITSTTAEGTYTNDTKGTMNVTLNFRKNIKVKNPSITLNIKNNTSDTTTVSTSDVTEPANKLSFSYTVQDGDLCDLLEVTKFEFEKITDENDIDISNYVNVPANDSNNKLSDNKKISIVTGDLTVKSVILNDTGDELTIEYSSEISKNSRNIEIEMTSDFKAPAVLSESEYKNCNEDIQNYYTEGTNGAFFEASSDKLKSDTEKKYILNFDTNPDDETLVNLFKNANKHKVSVPVKSTKVTIVDRTKIKIDLSDNYTLPVKGANYTVKVPAALVLNVLGKESNEGTGTVTLSGLEKPYIRIQKSKVSIVGTTITQPATASVKIDCQTPGAQIKYKKVSKTSAPKVYETINKVMERDSNSDPTKSDFTKVNFNDYSEFSIGDANDYNNGYKVYIAAKAEKDGKESEEVYELAYRSVVRFKDEATIAGLDYRWIRGGDAIGGGVTTPGFPLSWNNTELDKIQAMTKKDGTYVWISWAVNTECYFGFLAGDMPEGANEKGPQNVCWGSCNWVGAKSEYPLYPGESRQLNSKPTLFNGKGDYAYQEKHKEKELWK